MECFFGHELLCSRAHSDLVFTQVCGLGLLGLLGGVEVCVMEPVRVLSVLLAHRIASGWIARLRICPQRLDGITDYDLIVFPRHHRHRRDIRDLYLVAYFLDRIRDQHAHLIKVKKSDCSVSLLEYFVFTLESHSVVLSIKHGTLGPFID